jgi:hypothetical protein
MNVHDELSDNEVLRAAGRSLSAIPLAEPPDAGAIMARGRGRRRRRLTGLGAVGTAVAAVAALGVAGVFGGGTTPVNAAGTIAPVNAPGTIRTAAFTLVKDANGTAKLTLTQDQQFNPVALQQALRQDGIPALVRINTFCSSTPEPPSAGVISIQLPDGTPVPPPSAPGTTRQVPPDAVMVINPAKLAAGTELTFNYLDGNHEVHFGVIYTNSYTCGAG